MAFFFLKKEMTKRSIDGTIPPISDFGSSSGTLVDGTTLGSEVTTIRRIVVSSTSSSKQYKRVTRNVELLKGNISNTQVQGNVQSQGYRHLTRYYDSCVLYSPTIKNSTEQIFLVHDFQLTDECLKVNRKKVAAVVILKRTFAAARKLLSFCSLCSSGKFLNMFVDIQWETFAEEDLNRCRFAGCIHTYPCISTMIHSLSPLLKYTSEADIEVQIFSLLINNSERIEKDTLLVRSNHVQISEGSVVAYLSLDAQIFVGVIKRNKYDYRYISCFLCPRSIKCHHLTIIPKKLQNDLLELDDDDDDTDDGSQKEDILDDGLEDPNDGIHSKMRYPFQLQQDLQLCSVVRCRVRNPVNWCSQNLTPKTLRPEIVKCCDTIPQLTCASQSNNKNVIVVCGSLYVPLEITLEKSICLRCKNVYFFDGRSLGLINYRNTILFTVEYLWELLDFKCASGMPTFAYVRAKTHSISRLSLGSPELIKRIDELAGKINMIMTAFNSLIEYPSDEFYCCKDPSVVCVDGIVLSCDQRYIENQKLTTPWLLPQIRTRFNTRTERSLIRLSSEDIEVLTDYLSDSGCKLDSLTVLCNKYQDNPTICWLKLTTEYLYLPHKYLIINKNLFEMPQAFSPLCDIN